MVDIKDCDLTGLQLIVQNWSLRIAENIQIEVICQSVAANLLINKNRYSDVRQKFNYYIII